MMDTLKTYAITLVGALMFGAGLWLGNTIEATDHARTRTRLAETQRDAEAAIVRQRAAALDAQRRIAALDSTSQTLTAQVLQADAARQAAEKEHEHAIRKLAAGRPCLSGELTRLLNQQAGMRSANHAAAPRGAGGAPAGAAADSDVALWIGGAIERYDGCRARIDALRQWRAQASALFEE